MKHSPTTNNIKREALPTLSTHLAVSNFSRSFLNELKSTFNNLDVVPASNTSTANNLFTNNGIIIIPEIIPQELPQHEDIMDKKARQKLKKAIRDKAYREKNKEIIKIKSALHYQEKKNK